MVYYRIMGKIVYKIIFLLLITNYLHSQEITLFEEYFLMLDDLANVNTYGYKSHFLDYNFDEEVYFQRVTGEINFHQGSLKSTNRHLDFAIVGNGYFKIIKNDGTIVYTRNGEFVLNEETNELQTINGYRLFDSLIIIPGFIELIINEDHSIITIYPNGEEINNGKIIIYDLEINKLMYPENYLFAGNDIPYFIYFGEVEEISNDRIYNKMLECSNVNRTATMTRILKISQILGMDFIENNYGE